MADNSRLLSLTNAWVNIGPMFGQHMLTMQTTYWQAALSNTMHSVYEKATRRNNLKSVHIAQFQFLPPIRQVQCCEGGRIQSLRIRDSAWGAVGNIGNIPWK